MDYTTLSLADSADAVEAVARDAQTTFGALDAAQLNWRPDATRWSVAQCLEHLVVGDRLMRRRAEDALREAPRTLWQRVPLLPGFWGRMLIRSQSPDATRKFTAPTLARPTSSAVADDVVRRFVDQHLAAAEWMRTLSEPSAARAVMVSPYAAIVTYSVLDACRLIAAHDRRHLEQARRVTTAPGFPSANTR